MKNICKITGKEFEITDFEIKFLEKIAPTFNGQKFEIPLPTICPEERMRRRTAHRNEFYFHHNKSAMSGKPLISIYRPDCGQLVYSNEEWFSDKWDALSYGQDFNPNRSFFEQIDELNKKVPKVTTVTVGNENCDFTTGTGYSKNCYLINCSEYCQDCYYGKLLQKCSNCIDCSFAYDCELCYECFNVKNCYNCQYVYNSQNSYDCFFCDDIKNCKNCFLSANLVGKEYYFLNQQLSKEEYEKRVSQFKGSYQNYEAAKHLFNDLRAKRIYKYANILNSENCNGDFITNSSNCKNCFEVSDSEELMNVQVGVDCKDLLDCSNMYLKPELSYEVLGTIQTYNVHFCLYVFHCSNLFYCQNMYNSKNCFGCIGLRNKEYCILNKQYSKEDYEILVAKIIEHMMGQGKIEWGEFFPISSSLAPYNESVAQDYLPLTEKESLEKGYKWGSEDTSYQHQGGEYQIPDNINDVKNDITQAILKCELTGKLYKIIPQELKIYKQQGIPIPHKSPQQRYKERLNLRNQFTIYKRNCSNCNLEVESTYSKEKMENIYCEKCYLKSVY